MKNNTEESKKLKQMFVLNWLANVNSNYAAVSSKQLEENTKKIQETLEDKTIQKMVGGQWCVSWGPAVGNQEYERTYKKFFKTKKIKRWVTDNAMYVAKKGENEYFIGISGTNGISLDGWFKQDFDVQNSVHWPPSFLDIKSCSANGEAKISQAASNGIEALWKLRPIKGTEKEEKSLIDYILYETKGKVCTISIGGHSLGGCLTPLVATAIRDRMLQEDKEAYAQVTLRAYPTAGPTPGNQDFANHLQNSVNEYHAVYNENDLVPLSWGFEKKKLDALKKHYGGWKFGMEKIMPESLITRRILRWASHVSKENKFVHKPVQMRENFKITTWKNDLIPKVTLIIDSKGKLKQVDLEREKLGSAFLAMGSILRYNSRANAQLKRIYQRQILYKVSVARFVSFLVQVLAQHVGAYLNPQADHIPWTFSQDELEAIKLVFTRPKLSSKIKNETNEWKVATGIVLIAKLGKLAADWLEKHPKKGYLEEVEYIEGNKDDVNIQLKAPETEEQGIENIEKLLQEIEKSGDGDLLFGNLYDPSSNIDTE